MTSRVLWLFCLLASASVAGCLGPDDALRPLAPDARIEAPDWRAGDHWVWSVERLNVDDRPGDERSRGKVEQTVLRTDHPVLGRPVHWLRVETGGQAATGTWLFGAGDHLVDPETRDRVGRIVEAWAGEDFDGPTYLRDPAPEAATWRFPLGPVAVPTETSEHPERSTRTVLQVVGRTSVDTPAGRFDAVRLDREVVTTWADPKLELVSVERTWYAPAVGHVVRQEVLGDGAVAFDQEAQWSTTYQVTELVAYQPGDGVPRAVPDLDTTRSDLLVEHAAADRARARERATDPLYIGFETAPPVRIVGPGDHTDVSNVTWHGATTAYPVHIQVFHPSGTWRDAPADWNVTWALDRAGSRDAVGSVEGHAVHRLHLPGPDRYTAEAAVRVPLADGGIGAKAAQVVIDAVLAGNASYEQPAQEAPGSAKLAGPLEVLDGTALEVAFNVTHRSQVRDDVGLFLVNGTAGLRLDDGAVFDFERPGTWSLVWHYRGPAVGDAAVPRTMGHSVTLEFELRALRQ